MHDVWLIARDGARMQALAERYPQIRDRDPAGFGRQPD